MATPSQNEEAPPRTPVFRDSIPKFRSLNLSHDDTYRVREIDKPECLNFLADPAKDFQAFNVTDRPYYVIYGDPATETDPFPCIEGIVGTSWMSIRGALPELDQTERAELATYVEKEMDELYLVVFGENGSDTAHAYFHAEIGDNRRFLALYQYGMLTDAQHVFTLVETEFNKRGDAPIVQSRGTVPLEFPAGPVKFEKCPSTKGVPITINAMASAGSKACNVPVGTIKIPTRVCKFNTSGVKDGYA